MIAADTVASESDADRINGEPAWAEDEPATDGHPAWAKDEPATDGRPAWAEDEPASECDPSAPDADSNWPAPEEGWSGRQAAYRQLWGPPGRGSAPPQALGQPYVWDGAPSDPDGIDHDDPVLELAGALRSRHSADPLTGSAPTTERAVIGDEIRELAAWCQIGACIARHTDPEALGEVDIRNRAVAAGWCVDLFGRLICPSCQQIIPVWSTLALVGRDRAAGQPLKTADAQIGRHRRTRWPTPTGVDPVR